MPTLITSIFRLVAMAIAGLLGLGMDLNFIGSSCIAIIILLLTGRIASRPSAIREYFMRAQRARKPMFKTGAFYARAPKPPGDIIDVEAREIK